MENRTSKYSRPTLDLGAIRKIDAINSRAQKVYEAALYYISAGFKVLPIQVNSKNLPPSRTGINFSNSSSNVETIEKWFNPSSGMFAGWNISLAVGYEGGPFVIDLDKHSEDKNGFDSWYKIRPDGHKFEGPKSSTPNNGTHLFYMWEPNMITSTNKVGNGIDTRGGRGDTISSNIMVWPSVVEGKPYKWKTDGILGDVPMWLKERIGVAWNPNQGSGRGITDDKADYEDEFSAEQIEEMLAHIDPDDLDYQEWLGVGQAVNSQIPTEEGLALWDKWSQRGDRYEEKECQVRWKGFSPDGAVRVGSLIMHARAGGYNIHYPQSQIIDDKVTQTLIDRLNEEFAIVPVGSGTMVLQEGVPVNPSSVIVTTNYRLIKKQSFIDITATQKELIETGQGIKAVPVSQIWWEDPRRREFMGGMVFEPDRDGNFDGFYNTWQGFAYKPEAGDWSILRGHILDNICCGDENNFAFLMDWVADMFQDPANPKGVAVVLKGREGSGKGVFMQALGKIMGYHYVHITDSHHLTGNFNNLMSSKILVFADEAFYGGDKKSAGKLKAVVSEKTIMIEQKGVDAFPLKNCMRLGMASNEKWVVPAGGESRRWFVLDVGGDKSNDAIFFGQLQKQLDNGGYEALLAEMMERKITSNLREAPVTKALIDQRERLGYTDPTIEWIAMALINNFAKVFRVDPNEEGRWPEHLSPLEIYEAFNKWTIENRKSYTEKYGPFLTSFKKHTGITGSKRIRTGGGGNSGRISVYKIPEREMCLEEFRKITSIDLREEHDDEEDRPDS